MHLKKIKHILVFSSQKCLDGGLAEMLLMSALKLFLQARVTDLKSCIVVMRIFRDMCNRRPEWQPVKGWVSDAESWRCLDVFFFFYVL